MRVMRKVNDVFEQLTGRRLMRRSSDVSAPRELETRRILRGLQIRAVYAGLSELHLRSQRPNTDATNDLRMAELKVFSQNGEDGVIDVLVRALGSEPYFVEFGVGDGSECNTRLLAEVLGWSGLYIEPEKAQFDNLTTRFGNSTKVACVNTSVSPENVNELFSAAGVPRRFGLLSIDVDGQDYWIWQALLPDYRPDVVVVECNTSYPAGVKRVEARGLSWSEDFSDSFGASIGALADLAEQKGYSLVHIDLTGVNAFFVERSALDRCRASFVGLTDRSPNYYLNGKGHPTGVGRPTVTIGHTAGDT